MYTKFDHVEQDPELRVQILKLWRRWRWLEIRRAVDPILAKTMTTRNPTRSKTLVCGISLGSVYVMVRYILDLWNSRQLVGGRTRQSFYEKQVHCLMATGSAKLNKLAEHNSEMLAEGIVANRLTDDWPDPSDGAKNVILNQPIPYFLLSN